MKYIFFILGLLTVLLGWSCEKTAITIPNTPITEGARIRFVHAAPEAAGVDLFLDDQKISGNNPTSAGATVPTSYSGMFPGTSAYYAVVSPGQLTAKLSAPAATTASSATVVTTAPVTLESNKYYSLFAIGAGAQPEVLLLPDDLSVATDPSKFYVRFINLVVGGADYDLVLTKGEVLQSKIGYKAASSFVGLDVAKGASFEIRPTGSSSVFITASSTSNVAGRVMTVIATGIADKKGALAPRAFVYVNR